MGHTIHELCAAERLRPNLESFCHRREKALGNRTGHRQGLSVCMGFEVTQRGREPVQEPRVDVLGTGLVLTTAWVAVDWKQGRQVAQNTDSIRGLLPETPKLLPWKLSCSRAMQPQGGHGVGH